MTGFSSAVRQGSTRFSLVGLSLECFLSPCTALSMLVFCLSSLQTLHHASVVFARASRCRFETPWRESSAEDILQRSEDQAVTPIVVARLLLVLHAVAVEFVLEWIWARMALLSILRLARRLTDLLS